MAYRRYIDEHMHALLQDGITDELGALVELGLAHEQQHQELLLMDLLHLFSRSPLHPAYDTAGASRVATGRRARRLAGGLVEIGHDGQGFAFDNEGPRHQVFLPRSRSPTAW